MSDRDWRELRLEDGTQENWAVYLDEFDETMWPIFETRGYSRDAALTVWMLNRAVNHIQRLIPDDDE